MQVLYYVWKYFSVIREYLKLPKLGDWKDVEVFYAYLRMLINSEFAKLVAEITPFYLDDKIRDMLIIRFAGESVSAEFRLIHSFILGLEANIPDDIKNGEVLNFVRTVLAVRSIFTGRTVNT